MKQATKRLLSSAAALILFMASFFVFVSLVGPSFQTAQDLRGEELGLQNVIQTQVEITDRVKKAISEYNGEGDARDAVSEVLPLSPNVAQALAGMSGIAGNTHMVLQSVSLQAGSNQANTPSSGLAAASSTPIVRPIGVLNFQMKLTGTYEDFKNFIQNLETDIRIADVKTVAIEHAGKPAQNSFLVSVVASVYYQTP